MSYPFHPFICIFNILSRLSQNPLRYCAPVDVRFFQLAHTAPQKHVCLFFACGIVVENAASLIARHLHYLSVARDVGNLQVESHAALLRSLQITGSAELKVGLGNAETVVGLAHDVDALAGVLAQLVGRHEQTERLVGTAPHPAAQLMELRQTETLGFEDDHHRCIGHVDTHLDDGGGHKYLRLATDKLLHLNFLLGGFHLTVHLTHTVLGEHLAQRLVAVLKVLQVYLLAFLNQGEDDINLSANAYLLAYAVVERRDAVVEEMTGNDWLATGRQLVDDTDVQIAVEGHRQSARDRRGGHHEDVWRVDALAPQFGPLRHTEAVLLVTDNET